MCIVIQCSRLPLPAYRTCVLILSATYHALGFAAACSDEWFVSTVRLEVRNANTCSRHIPTLIWFFALRL